MVHCRRARAVEQRRHARSMRSTTMRTSSRRCVSCSRDGSARRHRRHTRRRSPSRPGAARTCAPDASRSIECGAFARGAPAIHAASPSTGSGAPSARSVSADQSSATSVRPSARAQLVRAASTASPESSRDRLAERRRHDELVARRRVRPGEIAPRAPSRAAARRQPAVDRERRVGRGDCRRRRTRRRASRSAATQARASAPPRAVHARRARAPTITARSRRTVSSSTALSGVVFSCDCQTSCARARSPFAHSTSPRCAAISASGRCVERAPQVAFGFVELAQAEVRPAHAVEDERIVGRELVRALDQREAFGRARRAIDERVAERVQRLRVRRASARSTRVSCASTTSILSSFSATIAVS